MMTTALSNPALHLSISHHLVHLCCAMSFQGKGIVDWRHLIASLLLESLSGASYPSAAALSQSYQQILGQNAGGLVSLRELDDVDFMTGLQADEQGPDGESNTGPPYDKVGVYTLYLPSALGISGYFLRSNRQTRGDFSLLLLLFSCELNADRWIQTQSSSFNPAHVRMYEPSSGFSSISYRLVSRSECSMRHFQCPKAAWRPWMAQPRFSFSVQTAVQRRE